MQYFGLLKHGKQLKNFWNKLLTINESFGNLEDDPDLQIPKEKILVVRISQKQKRF